MTDQMLPLFQVGGVVTLFGLVYWIVRRVFTHTIPRLAGDFKESLATQQKLFSDTLENQQKQFVDTLSRQRDDFREQIKRQHDDFRESLRTERDHRDQRINQLILSVDRLVDAFTAERVARISREKFKDME